MKALLQVGMESFWKNLGRGPSKLRRMTGIKESEGLVGCKGVQGGRGYSHCIIDRGKAGRMLSSDSSNVLPPWAR